MKTMRAALLHKFGEPLQLADVRQPTAAAGEVLLEVEACGVCHSDLHVARGDWPNFAKLIHFPVILGHEVVGRVVELGAGVDAQLAGARVGVPWIFWTCGECVACREGRENICKSRAITGVSVNGGYAEYMLAKASHVIPVPESLSSAEAAPLFCAGVTVYRALRQAHASTGQRIAVFGAGGLGNLAIQIAKALGADVIAVDINDEKLELAREAGASQVLNAAKTKASAEIAASGGADIALVAAGTKAAYDSAFTSIRPGGTVLVVGLPPEPLSVDAGLLVRNEARVIGSAVGTRQDVRETLALAAGGKLHCRTESRPLERVNDILEAMHCGQLFGRVVLAP
jgi:alcohol dehydrogenase, propanol-preferring